MTALSSEEVYVARAAVEENKRLCKLLCDLSRRDHVNEGIVVEVGDSIFSLQRRNELLKNDISILESQLNEGDLGYTDTVLEYNRLREKRGHLRNETQSLRNILNNQTPKVREAERIQLERKKIMETSNEKNEGAKDETRRLKELREREMRRANTLLRREAYLQDKLDKMLLPLDPHDRRAIRAAISKCDRTIQKLKVEINRYQYGRPSHSNTKGDDLDGGLTKLKEEYYALRDRLDELNHDLSPS
uniref:Uncharacterized protein n=1 Tax=Trypanosoma congolense (strain IL3000) TaxID=1068625 RepID=G0UW89_TRYCI|nr:conserved hypothetical protein [Trypanosoma congolense IL3000]